MPSEAPGTTAPTPFPPPMCRLAMPTSAPGNSVVREALSLGKPMAALFLKTQAPRGACGRAAQAHRKAPSVGTPEEWECLCPVPAATGASCPLDSLLKPLASPSWGPSRCWDRGCPAPAVTTCRAPTVRRPRAQHFMFNPHHLRIRSPSATQKPEAWECEYPPMATCLSLLGWSEQVPGSPLSAATAQQAVGPHTWARVSLCHSVPGQP